MAAKPHRHGTAKQLSDIASGYVASGSSIFTRKSAHGTAPTMKSRSQMKRRRGTRNLPDLISEVVVSLAHLEGMLRVEDDGSRREKLLKNHRIKSEFLVRLYKELEAR
jgi:hypothetical protein